MTRCLLRVAFGLHAVSVTALLALFVVLAVSADPEVGANIGAGIVLLLLLAIGLPWSLPSLLGPEVVDTQAAGPFVAYLAGIGPAVLNVGLHALALWLLRRRTGDP